MSWVERGLLVVIVIDWNQLIDDNAFPFIVIAEPNSKESLTGACYVLEESDDKELVSLSEKFDYFSEIYQVLATKTDFLGIYTLFVKKFTLVVSF